MGELQSAALELQQLMTDLPDLGHDDTGPRQPLDQFHALAAALTEQVGQILDLPIIILPHNPLKTLQKQQIILREIAITENLLQKLAVHRLLLGHVLEVPALALGEGDLIGVVAMQHVPVLRQL